MTAGIVTIDYAHEKIHTARTFHAHYKSPEGSDVADNAAIVMLIATGARETHFVFEVAAGGDAELAFYGEITASNNGTPLQAVHLNRNGLMTPAASVFIAPTITDYGAVLHNSLVPGGVNNFSGGGTSRAGTEWNLKYNSKYAVVLTNRGGSAQPMSIGFQWYEE